MPKPYPAAFRQEVLEAVSNRGASETIAEIAAHFGVHETTIAKWRTPRARANELPVDPESEATSAAPRADDRFSQEERLRRMARRFKDSGASHPAPQPRGASLIDTVIELEGRIAELETENAGLRRAVAHLGLSLRTRDA